MKKILVAFAAACLLIPASCTKEVPVRPEDRPQQEHFPTDGFEYNQNVLMTDNTGKGTLVSLARFQMINYLRTGEQLLSIETYKNAYAVSVFNLSQAGTYPISITPGSNGIVWAVVSVPGGFLPLPYDPGTITINSIGQDRIVGSIDARMYNSSEAFWEGVDTIFLNIRGSFDAKLNRIDR
jgi:hypothetical protein